MSRQIRRPFTLLSVTILASLAMVGIGGPASAASTLNVGPGQAYTTISAAVAAATAGDTISVADGVYAESVNVNKAITLTAVNPRSATISNVVTLTAAANLTGFTLGAGVIVNAGGAGSTISNNTITGSGQLIAITGTPKSATVVTTVSGNTIENVGVAGQPNGLFINASSSLRIVGNIIRNTGAVPANSVGVNVANGLGDIVVSGNTISGFENAIAVLVTAATPVDGVVIGGNTISNTTNSAVVLANANLSNVSVTENSFTSVGTSGPTRAAVQVGVPGVDAPGGSTALDALVIGSNTVTNAPNGVVFRSNVVLADSESAVISNNTFSGVTGSAILVDPAVTESVAASGNDFGGAAVTGNVVVAAAPAAVPGLPATGVSDVLPLAGAALLLLLVGAVLLLRRRTA